MQSLSRRTLLNYIGIAILILGIGTGEFVYWRGLKSEESTDPDSPYTSRVYEQDVQRTVGVFGLIMVDISQALHDPGTMGISIAVVSAALAGGCFFVASRMPPE
jgi:hypothetical protein